LIVGTSVARGAFVGQAAARAALGEGGDAEFMQTAWGGDAEYSRDHYLLRVETIVSRWQMPIAAVTPAGQVAVQSPLSALSVSLEGRYKVRPGLYVASRYDHLGFSDESGSAGPLPWDAPVTRIEAGVGYSIQRNLLLKVSVQDNHREGGVLQPVAHILAAQLAFWF
jgi:predicted porin